MILRLVSVSRFSSHTQFRMQERWCNLDLGPSAIDNLLKTKPNQTTVGTTSKKMRLSFLQIDDLILNFLNYFIPLFTFPKTWKKEHSNLKEHWGVSSSYFLFPSYDFFLCAVVMVRREQCIPQNPVRILPLHQCLLWTCLFFMYKE